MNLAELQAFLARHNVAEMRVRLVRTIDFAVFEAKLIVPGGAKTRVVKANGADIESAIKAALAQLAS